MNKFTQSAFIRFFTKFPQLLLASLLFTVPFALFTAVFAFVGYLTGFNNIVVWLLGIIPSFPIYSGFVMIVRKYAVEKVDCKIIEVFFRAVKENWKKSLLNGMLCYVIVTCAVFALMYYGTMMNYDFVYGSIFTMYMFFSIALLIMMFYVPIMTVTYELRLRDIYKNSLLLILGKILRNLVALLLVAVISVAAFFLVDFSGDLYSVVSIVVTVVLYPLLYTYVTVAVISKGLQENVGSFVAKSAPVYEDSVVSIDMQRLEKDGNSDYIYVNGRMIKNPHKDEEEKTL